MRQTDSEFKAVFTVCSILCCLASFLDDVLMTTSFAKISVLMSMFFTALRRSLLYAMSSIILLTPPWVRKINFYFIIVWKDISFLIGWKPFLFTVWILTDVWCSFFCWKQLCFLEVGFCFLDTGSVWLKQFFLGSQLS